VVRTLTLRSCSPQGDHAAAASSRRSRTERAHPAGIPLGAPGRIAFMTQLATADCRPHRRRSCSRPSCRRDARSANRDTQPHDDDRSERVRQRRTTLRAQIESSLCQGGVSCGVWARAIDPWRDGLVGRSVVVGFGSGCSEVPAFRAWAGHAGCESRSLVASRARVHRVRASARSCW
jgi:hypothetical protein